MSTDIKPRRETVTEPPKRWRNKYQASQSCTYRNGEFLRIGNIYWSPSGPWPTKDIAETRAQHSALEWVAKGHIPDIYLGAFPVDE